MKGPYYITKTGRDLLSMIRDNQVVALKAGDEYFILNQDTAFARISEGLNGPIPVVVFDLAAGPDQAPAPADPGPASAPLAGLAPPDGPERQSARRPSSLEEEFRLALKGEGPRAEMFRLIHESLTDAGVTLDPGNRRKEKAFHTCAVTAIVDTWVTYGADIFDQTFEVLTDSFGGHPDSLGRMMIKGVSYFLSRFHSNPAFEQHILVSLLKEHSPATIIKEGRELRRSKPSVGVSHRILQIYNGGNGFLNQLDPEAL